MARPKEQSAQAQIVAAARKHFGQDVARVSAPGGENRSSFRLHLTDRTVIATLRPNFRRTHLEAHVLTELGRHCSDLPECLGVVGEIMFQSDVGKRRLNVEVAQVAPAVQLDLAGEAVSAIFRIHGAARQTELNAIMPHLGNNRDWVLNFVDAVDFLKDLGGGISDQFDRTAAYERINAPARQFVKWDCRSGNAAIGRDDKLRWFDFEYAGLRHGAEDIAWLIGDEAWPVAPQDMVDVVIDAFDPTCGILLPDYLDYLSVYLTFHAVQRLKLISKEAKKRGWLSKDRIRRYDDAGVHPEFAAHICRVGAYFSDQSELTAPLTRNFLEAQAGFDAIVAQTEKQRSA
ncbi:MAG: hypothetical protein ACU0CJ_00990 [Sulfitobacter sp.]|jgi:hypothetical protein|uniref:hypothetical protein n=1 Tax=unclassified Sulfitobacter TaxID=196795 RepID=UPI0007C3763B|nr:MULTISPECIES: hypothetical protein [unclassified Sulfitobacter]KZX95271.1 hypothetical protein A3720_03770 [Sulfitobacter sp. HI0021]KZY02480.1 hypothetical protein A3722_00245 [Sulfitobacter sp. HI0027]KZZ03387.1 hypothetical protein A3747_11880 [Sulfitobacter sp. HI0076]WPZ30359.1 hypothetical protein T8A63_04675 [Sulfitobacter sp. OXR-159]